VDAIATMADGTSDGFGGTGAKVAMPPMPTATQSVVEGQERPEVSGAKEPTGFWAVQVAPPSVVIAETRADPSPRTKQTVELGQETVRMLEPPTPALSTLAGGYEGLQVNPPSCVVKTIPSPSKPKSAPTTVQDDTVGQARPETYIGTPSGPCCDAGSGATGVQIPPPLAVT
jgi:hypothetical protein